MEIKDNMESLLDDLDNLNDLFNKNYINIDEWYTIKGRIVDKMIEDLNKSKEISDTLRL